MLNPVISLRSMLMALKFDKPASTRLVLLTSCAALALLVEAPSGHAQSFDCARARTPIETAICASPDLIGLDNALAMAWAAALETSRDNPAQTLTLRNGQREWIAARDRNCAAAAGNPARLAACVGDAYRTRIAALSALPVAQAPRLPNAPPAPAATLAQPTVSAAADGEALIDVASPGRFSLRAASKTGVALQLVDMIAGPGEIAGDSGARDGRLDVLLDKGAYKLRTFGDKKASGEAALAIEPFRAAAPVSAELLRGGAASADLVDLQQRSWWIIVDASQKLSFEAAGRSLQDLRAWRNGTDLAELQPTSATISPKPGRPLTRLRLDGALEPGLYLVTAYGGAALPWADGDTSMPLHVRAGAPELMVGGWREAAIGPLGSLRFEVPAPANHIRLELPEPAPARLTAGRGANLAATATIARNSREPLASVSLALSATANAIVEVSGLEGQSLRLRALQPSTSLRVDAAGPHLFSVDVAGEGGDDVPATPLLAKYMNGAATVVASHAPRIAPGAAWRRRFNLRGVTTLIFEITTPGPVAANVQGVNARTSLEPLVGARPPRGDAKTPNRWDVEPGWYVLKLEPVAGALGVADLTFGQPGLAAPLEPLGPPRGNIDLGLQTIERPAYYQVFVNSAPGLVTGPKARALPADLAAAALTLQQPARTDAAPAPVVAPPPLPVVNPPPPPRAGARQNPPKPANAGRPPAKPGVAQKPAPLPPKPTPVLLPARTATPEGALVVQTRTPVGGRIIAADKDGRPIEISLSNESIEKDIRSATITVPPSENARLVILSFVKTATPAPVPAIGAPGDAPKLVGGAPVFLDLEDGARRGFELTMSVGGLTRIETLGRLKTELSLSTPFLPRLNSASDNGPGRNALLQTWLRAGSYRVAVSASQSAGRLGLVARPAKLIDAGLLLPEASVRGALAAGEGAMIPIEIAEAGVYQLDVYGLKRAFTTRLEDSAGWPLTQPGKLTSLEQRFEPGRYRLVLMPETVDARFVVRLQRVEYAAPLTGHGPHNLPFGATQAFQWREPAGKDAPRAPDRWQFELQGPANVSLDITDGMTGDLIEVTGQARPVAKIAYKRNFAGVLPAGRYMLEARALGRNDRLDYELNLRAKEIQPGQARNVELPANIPFAIGQDRVVTLTTYGRNELRAVLKDANGKPVERLAGRTDDWNIAMSRLLPAGDYQLELAEAKAAVSSAQSADDDDEPPARGGADAEAHAKDNAIEVRLDLPVAAPERDLQLGEATVAKGEGIHNFNLPPVEVGALLAIAARSPTELVLSLERRDSDAIWRVQALDRGRAPVIALPADGDASKPWRVSAWAIDGGATEIAIGARAVRAQAQPPGLVTFAPLAIDGVATKLAVAAVNAPGKAPLVVKDQVIGLLQGSRPGRPLAASEIGALAPQSERLWLLARDDNTKPARVEPLPASTGEIALDLAPGDVAILPAAAAGAPRIWRARSAFGQPGIAAGRGTGVGAGVAIAFAGDDPVRVWNAGSNEALRLRVDSMEARARPDVTIQTHYASVLAPGAAQLVRLPAGHKHIRLDLAADVAAHASGGGGRDATLNAANATTRRLAGAWTQTLLVNLGKEPAPIALEIAPAPEEPVLAAGAVMKRFSGAAGSVTLPVRASLGDRLVVAGGSATFIGDDGRVSRGSPIDLANSGELTIEHAPGLIVAWIENARATPWAMAPATPLVTPQVVRLAEAAKGFALNNASPVLLHARTNAPVIMALKQGATADAPELFPAGAEFHRYLKAGDAELRLYSPHDGPLSGALELTTTPVAEASEGVGQAQALAPGATALFSFEVTRAANIGVGVRSTPDRAAVRLLDANGKPISEGVAQLRRLEPGRYLIEARAPANGETLLVRPAIVGVAPPDTGPPPDVAARYLELVGLTPARTR